MSEQTTTFRDTTLSLEQAYYYSLLLLVDDNTFSYGISFKNKLLAYGTNCAISELADPRNLEEILTAAYKNTIVGITASGFTLVPQDIFKNEQVAKVARLLDVKPEEKVLAQVLDDKNHVIYKVGEQTLADLAKFMRKNIVFSAMGLIKLIAQNTPLNTNLYLNVANNKAEFLYFKNNSLRFYNSFEFKNADDVVYYAALVAQELTMQAQFTSLIVSGNISADDEIYSTLANFFPNISFNTIQLADAPAHIAPHQIISLVALSLCGSSEVF